MYFRVVDGRLRSGDDIRLMNTGKEFQVIDVGVLAPKPVQACPPTPHLSSAKQAVDHGRILIRSFMACASDSTLL